MIRIYLTGVFSIILGFAYTQQRAILGLRHQELYLTNFAYAGLEGQAQLSITYRDQWQKLNANPKTKNFALQLPLHPWHGAGGLILQQDETGLENRFCFRPSYNYIYSNAHYLLSSGFALAFERNSINQDMIKTPNGEYSNGQLDHKDDYLKDRVINSAITPSTAIYIQSKLLEAGFSLSYPLNIKKQISNFNYHPGIHALLRKKIFGSDLQTQNSYLKNWQIDLLANVFSDFIKTQTEISCQLQYNGNIFGGITLRGYNSSNLDALALFGGFRYNKKLLLAFQFEWPQKNINPNFGLGQEFGIFYNFNTKFGGVRKSNIIYNPRWSD